MRKRREPISPGVVIGLVASLIAYDWCSVGSPTDYPVVAYFWVIGVVAPLIGCWWVGRKHRSEGRGIPRSLVITLAMGAIAGTCVYPVIGTLCGLVLTAIFILPPTLWVAFLSIRGFRASREDSFARTIWWRRRWHATVAVGAGALAVRLYMAPATTYSLGLSLAIAAVSGLCLISLASMSAELGRLTEGAVPCARELDAPPAFDLGVGETVYATTAATGEGPYRESESWSPCAVGDLERLRAMMRHTLLGAVALTAFTASLSGVAGLALLRSR